MEQAINTFNKGLQLDTHPLVLGTDSLTDCLNGTLITMNGNEIILLNDMGNRRVDNAFLPSGYEPVGMKEYGGIIYVAAYNPITNKSLIGSFPSPQRKIDDLSDPKLKGEFNFSLFLSNGYSPSNLEQDAYLNNIWVIKTDSFLIPITGDNSLRAGDKFAIYSEKLFTESLDNDLLINQITNYNNVDSIINKAISPKNKRFTLQIGILNSQNKFVDITKTLCRWDENNEIIIYDGEKSDVYKFNDHYFISRDFTNKDFFETIEDAKLIKHRQRMAANTYAYKLVGPMYLKATLNHILNFNYNIYGIRENGSATLWIEGYITYNCPDGFTSIEGGSNLDYKTFSEGTPDTSVFKVFDLIDNTTRSPQSNPEIDKSVYNPNNNTYSTKIVKEYGGIEANDPQNSNIYNYVLGVLADTGTEGIYLRGLSVKGLLDLSLLGSGKVFINGWRFYNNLKERTTLFSFSFNAYPRYKEKFVNLKLRFDNINPDDSRKTLYYPREEGMYLPLYNGRQTYTINWSEELEYFEPRKVYKVTISYDILKEDGTTEHIDLVESDSNDQSIERWFLTTELFNEFYYPSAGVPDFCDLTKADESAANAFRRKMIIGLSGAGKIEGLGEEKLDYKGGLTNIGSNSISYICEHTYELSALNNSELSILKEELYPDFIEIENGEATSIKIDSVEVKKLGDLEVTSQTIAGIFKKMIPTKEGLSLSTDVDNSYKNETAIEVSFSNSTEDQIKGTIIYRDIYKAKGSKITHAKNIFDSVSNVIDDAIPANNLHSGVVVNFCDHGPNTSTHFIDIAVGIGDGTNPPGFSIPGGQTDGAEVSGGGNLWHLTEVKDNNGPYEFAFSEISNKVYSRLKENMSGIMFLYAFCRGNGYANTVADTNAEPINQNRTRVWWKGQGDKCAVFENLYTGGSFKLFVLGHLKHDYIYCMYDDSTYVTNFENTINVYAPTLNYRYSYIYKIPLTLGINYKVLEGKSTADIINIPVNLKVGNLVFSAGTTEGIGSDEVVINLISSQRFIDSIKTFNSDNISNIHLGTGKTMDSQGLPLKPNNFYYLKDGELVKVSCSFVVDRGDKIKDKKNALLSTTTILGSPKEKMLIASWDSHTTKTNLNYSGVYIIKEGS